MLASALHLEYWIPDRFWISILYWLLN